MSSRASASHLTIHGLVDGVQTVVAMAAVVGVSILAYRVFQYFTPGPATVMTSSGDTLVYEDMPDFMQELIDDKGWLFGPLFHPSTTIFQGMQPTLIEHFDLSPLDDPNFLHVY